MSEFNSDWQSPPPPLKKKITCSSSKCESDLHCFRTNMRKKSSKIMNNYRNGNCVCCGKDLVDWERIDKQDLNDIDYLFSRMKLEMIRREFWDIEIDDFALRAAKKKGLNQLRMETEKIIRKALEKPSKEQFRDGIQTKRSGNVIFYAQHATATCCRKCAEEWHKADRNKTLSDYYVKYFVELIMKYIQIRIPDITIEGEQSPELTH